MGERIAIHLEIYLPFRGKRIWRGEETVSDGLDVAGLLAQLDLGEPDLAVLVGGRHAPESYVLRPGDAVAILRQSEGG